VFPTTGGLDSTGSLCDATGVAFRSMRIPGFGLLLCCLAFLDEPMEDFRAPIR